MSIVHEAEMMESETTSTRVPRARDVAVSDSDETTANIRRDYDFTISLDGQKTLKYIIIELVASNDMHIQLYDGKTVGFRISKKIKLGEHTEVSGGGCKIININDQ